MCPPGNHHSGFVVTHALGHMNRTSCVQVHELPQSHCGDNREGTMFSCIHIYYAHLTSVRIEHPVCHGSLMTTYEMYNICSEKNKQCALLVITNLPWVL